MVTHTYGTGVTGLPVPVKIDAKWICSSTPYLCAHPSHGASCCNVETDCGAHVVALFNSIRKAPGV